MLQTRKDSFVVNEAYAAAESAISLHEKREERIGE
jgi:hypothetical protein